MRLNPYFRPTALECLKNRLFDKYRNKHIEKVLEDMNSQKQLELAFPCLAKQEGIAAKNCEIKL